MYEVVLSGFGSREMDGQDIAVLVRRCLREDRAERSEVLLQDPERDPKSVCIIPALLVGIAGGLIIGKLGTSASTRAQRLLF